MESAVWLATIYGVKTFRTSVVTLTLLGLKSSSANRNGICTHNVVAIVQQQKFVLGFQNEHLTSSLLSESVAVREAKHDGCHDDQGDGS